MKLLLATKTEIKPLNIQFLFKSSVIIANTYEEFLSKLHENIDTVGFTTKAINLLSNSSKFISLINGIRTLYGYNLVYFAEYTDAVASYMYTIDSAIVKNALISYSEVNIVEHLGTPELKAYNKNKEDSLITVESLPALLSRIEKTPDKLIGEITSSPKLLYDLLYISNNVQRNNEYLKKENNTLLSQKLYLLNLATKLSDENSKLIDTLNKSNMINDINYQALCSYKNRYDTYQETIKEVLKHGIANLKEDLSSTIAITDTTYPICVVYLKQVTHLRYLSTYINALLKILLDNRYIAKVLRVLPKNSTTKLNKYRDYYNTTYGLDAATYSKFPKFIHLGNPYNILNFMVSNVAPVDVLILIDETAFDNTFCYGKNVVKYHLAGCDTDAIEHDLSPSQCIVNETYESSNALKLERYEDFNKLKDSPELINVYYEGLELTKTLLTSIRTVLKSE